MQSSSKVETTELHTLLEAIYDRYGYDFRNYSEASIKRRVLSFASKEKTESIAEIRNKIIADPINFHAFLNSLTITVTEMYRDPYFYLELREKVVPYLKTYPEIKIWHAGCATGEEVYSTAILFKEEGLTARTMVYATDINSAALRKAKEGIYSLDGMKEASRNYFSSGGKASLSDYYTANYGAALFEPKLRENIVFADHNLASDSVFGEMNLIFCRNVLIYFNRTLQARVFNLLWQSLASGGFLCLGAKERASSELPDRSEFSDKARIYRRKPYARAALDVESR